MSTRTWQRFRAEAPEFAATVRERFQASEHHVLATLRSDGSPRVSGTEVAFDEPHITMGSMPGALKARDLQRDSRFAVHANPGDASMEQGDAKLSGTAVEVSGPTGVGRYRDPGIPPGPFHLFRLLITDAVVTSVEHDELRIRLWRPDQGVQDLRRQ